MSKQSWLPLSGVAFVLVAVIAVVVSGGEPPSADDPVEEIVAHYADNEGAVIAGAVLQAFAGVFLILFGTVLSTVFRASGPERGAFPLLPLIGASVLAIGLAIDGTISFALAEAAEDVDPAAVQALQALWDNDFLPLAMGSLLFLISSGAGIIRSGVLPKWLGWVGVVLGAVSLSPLGFFAILAGGIWILVVSVMLAMRARSATPDRPAAPAA